MPAYLVSTVIFIAVFLSAYAMLHRLVPSDFSRKLRNFAENRKKGLSGGAQSNIDYIWLNAAHGFGQVLFRHSALTPVWLRKKLDMAGFHDSHSANAFMGMIGFTSLAFGAVFLFVFVLLQRPFPAVIGGGLLGISVGFILPNFWLALKVKVRQKDILSGLPNAIDFLILCLEAGLSFNAAIMKTAQEQARINKDLSSEFIYTNQEIQAGKSRAEALRNLGARCGVDDLTALVSTMIQADKLGMSASRNLKVQAKTLRIKKRQRVKEIIGKMPIKMVFPLVFFIFPTLFIVLLGPSVITLMRNLPSGD
ncbi:MAG: type II secretion system F family protein [Candidatus Omnitrophota bacterium]